MNENEKQLNIETLELAPEIDPEAQETNSAYHPTLYSTDLGALAKHSTKDLKYDKPSNKASLSVNKDFSLTITGSEDFPLGTKDNPLSKVNLGVSAHKLLMEAVKEFTSINHTGSRARQLREREVRIPLEQYAIERTKGKVLEAPKDAPEEAEKERKRALYQRKNFLNKLRTDLNTLYNTSYEFGDTKKYKNMKERSIRPIEEKGIEDGYIYIKFSEAMANYLLTLPLNQFPEAIKGIDDRKDTAYALGWKLCTYQNTDFNILGGREHLIRVKNLLKETDLPSYTSPAVQKNGWINRIKEPFEKALEDLVAEGILVSPGGDLEPWAYSHSKGVLLTDEEAEALQNDYTQWENTFLYFNLKDAPDHTERLERKKAQIAEAKKKARKKKKKSSSESGKETKNES